MAYSRTEIWSRRLNEIEPLITRYHRWATGDIVLINPDMMDRVGYAVTKQKIRDENRNIWQSQ